MASKKYGMYGIADFPRSEHKSRVSKAQKLMQKDGIDCLLLTGESNIGYFSGFRGTAGIESVDYSTALLILPESGDPTLVISLGNRGNVEAMLAVGRADFVGWDGLELQTKQKYTKSLLDGARRAIVESKKNPSKIGLEMGQRLHVGASLDLLDQIRSKFPRTKFVDAAGIIWECRMIKSKLEVDYLTRSCEITCSAYERAFSKAKEGTTEREVAREVYTGMLEGGGEDMPLKMFLNIRAGPERYEMCDTRPTERPLRKGDILLLDGGLKYRGYFSDLTRLLCVGSPSPEQRGLFEAARRAEELGVAELKPGTKIGEVWNSVMANIESSGHIKYSLYEGLGHGIGLDIHEPPRIRHDYPGTLQPGMTLTMEPCLYDTPVVKGILSGNGGKGAGVFFVEDEVLITENGNKLLSNMSRELYIA